MGALVLGAAFGRRATHVEVRDADSGRLVAEGRARHLDLGPDVDVDDPTAWWRSLVAAVAQAGERDIAAMSVCGSHPGLVLLDGAGAVLRPVQPWAESHGERDAVRLRKALGAERWAHAAGMLPTPQAAVARLAWLRRTDPDTFGRIGAALLPHDWLTYRLAGRAVTDRGSASLTGAWSPSAERWIPEVLAELGGSADEWADRLPQVLGPSERADWLTAPVYELLGLRGRPVVAPGTGEPMAVALALGLGPGRAGLALAASTTALVGLAHPVADATGAVRSRADATGQHLATTGAPGGGALIESVARLLELPAGDLGALALSSGRYEEAPVLVPGVPGRTGAVITGIGGSTTRAGLARAAFEGVACAALDAIDQIIEVGATIDADEPIRVTGPEAGLDAHARVLADLAGTRVVAVPAGSLAAAGACVQAAAVLHQAAPGEVAGAWGLGGGREVEPAPDPDRLARRLAHAEERGRQRRALLEST